jgi:hypothetical protein
MPNSACPCSKMYLVQDAGGRWSRPTIFINRAAGDSYGLSAMYGNSGNQRI